MALTEKQKTTKRNTIIATGSKFDKGDYWIMYGLAEGIITLFVVAIIALFAYPHKNFIFPNLGIITKIIIITLIIATIIIILWIKHKRNEKKRELKTF